MATRRGKIAADFQNVWDSPSGRRVLAHLMERSGVIGNLAHTLPDGTTVDITDPTALAIAEGQRRMGVYIARQLAAKPGDFIDVVRDTQDSVIDIFKAA